MRVSRCDLRAPAGEVGLIYSIVESFNELYIMKNEPLTCRYRKVRCLVLCLGGATHQPCSSITKQRLRKFISGVADGLRRTTSMKCELKRVSGYGHNDIHVISALDMML